ncbi:hypothetical protein JN11_02804 [Mucilaginibacter frigoritolerans]|uniref:Uncharacterized protein n=1 Tax=Mucilaginibacter frigoritolerans TaxID=652788 RepID=A0A562U2F2_9SPHI|nr:hypothetical protein JN11_02804 [Mucilaginibacter frigoritolerans]
MFEVLPPKSSPTASNLSKSGSNIFPFGLELQLTICKSKSYNSILTAEF